MKKMLSFALATGLLLTTYTTTTTTATNAHTPVAVTLDGQLQSYSQPALLINNRAYLPFRAIFEGLQAEVSWDVATRTVKAVKGSATLELVIGKSMMKLNGREIQIDGTPQIVNDRTMVPVRFVAEAMGTQVKWAGDTKTVQICSQGCTQYRSEPVMTIDQSKEYTAIMHTDKGDVTIKLFDNEAPVTVNNFVFLARDKFYDGVKFHRIIQDFMIQTGDPIGQGTGGPGYTFKDELPPAKPYAPGIVAMANAGPNTNGSQFFIGTGESVKNLDNYPNYTVFGEVISGMDVIQQIAAVPVGANRGGEVSYPLEDVRIKSVTIQEK